MLWSMRPSLTVRTPRKAPSKWVQAALTALLSSLVFTGCGFKGPLALPGADTPPEPDTPASAEPDREEDEE